MAKPFRPTGGTAGETLFAMRIFFVFGPGDFPTPPPDRI